MNLKNRTIFFMGTTKFDGPEQSASYTIAKLLSKENSVYYIDYPFTLKDYLKLKSTPQVKFRNSHFSPFKDGLITTELPNFKIIILPLLLSINFLPEGFIYRQILKINEHLIIRRLKKIINKEKIKEFIFINSFNFHYPGIAYTLNPLLKVYHCVDPMIMPYDKKHGIISEADLVTNSDLVICTSNQLTAEKKSQNSNTFFIPNAADITHSIKALQPETQIDPTLLDIPHPIIGYTGTIERRIDYTLIKKVAEKNPDKSFVFAGKTNPEYIPDWFKKVPNIYLTGGFSFEQMPGILKGFDIAIIPFKKDDVSATIFPLKLFEYMGAGKPVISTSFNPDLRAFTKDAVVFCDDVDEFSKAIEEILLNDDDRRQQSRIAVAEQNTWEKRVGQFADLIDSNLP